MFIFSLNKKIKYLIFFIQLKLTYWINITKLNNKFTLIILVNIIDYVGFNKKSNIFTFLFNKKYHISNFLIRASVINCSLAFFKRLWLKYSFIL